MKIDCLVEHKEYMYSRYSCYLFIKTRSGIL